MVKKPKKNKVELDTSDVPWGDSVARQLLYDDVKAKIVPRTAKDANGKWTIPKLRDIYTSRPEFAEYSYKHFSSRLSTIRTIVAENDGRAEADQKAFENFKNNHPGSIYSQKGYIQWLGSPARKLLLQDLKDGLHNTLTKSELYDSRVEYYSEFTLSVFRDKVNQEIRTSKYVHTIKVKGKNWKPSRNTSLVE